MHLPMLAVSLTQIISLFILLHLLAFFITIKKSFFKEFLSLVSSCNLLKLIDEFVESIKSLPEISKHASVGLFRLPFISLQMFPNSLTVNFIFLKLSVALNFLFDIWYPLPSGIQGLQN